MAPAVMAILGNSAFVGLYLFAVSFDILVSHARSSLTRAFARVLQGVTASTFSLLVNHFVTRNPYYAAHGASGATYGAISFFACAFPKTTFLLFFVVPVPAWLCVSGIFAWDCYNGFLRRGGMTDSAGRAWIPSTCTSRDRCSADYSCPRAKKTSAACLPACSSFCARLAVSDSGVIASSTSLYPSLPCCRLAPLPPSSPRLRILQLPPLSRYAVYDRDDEGDA